MVKQSRSTRAFFIAGTAPDTSVEIDAAVAAGTAGAALETATGAVPETDAEVFTFPAESINPNKERIAATNITFIISSF